MRAQVREEPALVALFVAAATVFAGYSVVKHQHFGSGFDLAIFTQAVGHYGELEAPASSVKGVDNLLGDHFHPILVLLAPLLAVWEDARVLLVAQGVLVAGSIVPVYLFALPRLGRGAALVLAAAYAAFWGLHKGVGYEFHEVAFAPLLIGLAILAIDRRRWGLYFVSLALLLCVKEDMALVACFLGAYLLTLRELRWGTITIVAGLAWYQLSTRVLIPHFADGHPFTYWSYTQIGDNLGDAALNTLRRPWLPFEVFFSPREKVETLVLLLAPFLGLALCSRVALIAVPLLAERFLSTNEAFWGTSFHYSMAIAPVLAMAAAAGLANVARLAGLRARGPIVAAGAVTMLVAGLVASTIAVPPADRILTQVTAPGFYTAPAYAGPVRRGLERVPAGASVLAPDFVTPHLAARDRLYTIGADRAPAAEFLVAGLIRAVGANGPGGRATYRDHQRHVAGLLLAYVPVYYEDGWVVLRRRPAGVDGPGNGVLRPLPRAAAQRLVGLNARWQQAFERVVARFLGCTPLLRSGDSARAQCVASASADLRSATAALDRELAGAVPALVGGCRQLAILARAGVRGTAADFHRLERLGGRGTLRDYLRAARGATRRVTDRDLPGRPERFLLLCHPRPLQPAGTPRSEPAAGPHQHGRSRRSARRQARPSAARHGSPRVR